MPEVTRGFGIRSKGYKPRSEEPDLERGVFTEESRYVEIEKTAGPTQSDKRSKKHIRIAKSVAISKLHGRPRVESSSGWTDVTDSASEYYNSDDGLDIRIHRGRVKPRLPQELASVTKSDREGGRHTTVEWYRGMERERTPPESPLVDTRGVQREGQPIPSTQTTSKRTVHNPKTKSHIIQASQTTLNRPHRRESPTKGSVRRAGEMPKILSHDFETRLQELYESTVFHADEKSLTVNLASLHRLELLRLEKKLLKEAIAFKYQKPTPHVSFGETLTVQKYTKALADWEYIKACAAKGRMNDPFILTTERTRDLALLKEVAKQWRDDVIGEKDKPWHLEDEHLISKLDDDIKRLEVLPEPHDKSQPELFGGSRMVMNKKEKIEMFLRRLTMAGIGGAFLIGPMVIMVLKKSLLSTLLTTSLCVVAFGFILALFLDKPFDVLSGTAAYAAVLVVFVGTSTT